MTGSRVRGLAPLGLAALGLETAGLFLGIGSLLLPLGARADIVPTRGPRSLGTTVSGPSGGGCRSGSCQVGGGVSSGGKYLYHRFDSFDTRSGITSVDFLNGRHLAVIVGVMDKAGSFITAPVSFENRASVFWLSPGGISISGAGTFQNVNQLVLTTQTGLKVGSTWFDAFNSMPQDTAAWRGDIEVGRNSLKTSRDTLAEVGLSRNGAIDLQPDEGVSLSVDRSLLLDAGQGEIAITGASLSAGSEASPRSTTEISVLAGKSLSIVGSNLTAYRDGIVNLHAGGVGTLTDSLLSGLKLGLSANSLRVTRSQLVAPRGAIQLTAGRSIDLADSLLDVAPHTVADITGPGLGYVIENEGGVAVSSVPAVISLSTSDPEGSGIRVRNSTLDASNLVTSLVPPDFDWSQIKQDLIAGNVFLASASGLDVAGSTLRANADRNFAGQISLFALDPSRDLRLSASTLSASAAHGSGDITLYSEGTVHILDGTTITADTTGQEQTFGGALFHPGGEIRVTSQAAGGITIADSLLQSRYELSDLTDYSFWVDPLELDPSEAEFQFTPPGGKVRLSSAGAIALTNSTLDVSSQSGAGGTIEVLSASGGVGLTDSSLLARSGYGDNPPALGYTFASTAGRVSVLSGAGLSVTGGLIDASTSNLSLYGSPPPQWGEISLIAGGEGSSLDLNGTSLKAAGLPGSGDQGGTILVGNPAGSVSITNTSFDVSADTPGSLSVVGQSISSSGTAYPTESVRITPTTLDGLPSEGAAEQFQAASDLIAQKKETLLATLRQELGTVGGGEADQQPFSLRQLDRFRTILSSNDVDVIIDNRDPGNVTVTIVNRSLDASRQATSSTVATFNLNDPADRAALQELLGYQTFALLSPGTESATNGTSEQAAAQVARASTTTGKGGIESSNLGDSGSKEGSGSKGTGSTTVALLPRISALANSQANLSLQEGERDAARQMGQFLGAGTPLPPVPTLAELQKSLRAAMGEMGPASGSYKPAVLRFSFAEETAQGSDPDSAGAIDIVLVLPNGEPLGWRSRISLAALRDQLRAYYGNLAEQREPLGGAEDAKSSPERRLFQLMIEPALATLRKEGVTSLILSADPALIDIPFYGLSDGQHYLGEQFSLAVTPSLAFTNLTINPGGRLAAARSRMNAGASVFENGLSPLPMVEQELKVLSSNQAGAVTTLFNRGFTPGSFAKAFSDPTTNRVHIASHAEIAAGKERAPKIYTANEVIGLRDLAKLRQRSGSDSLDLVTLSACRSAVNAAELELGFAGLAVQLGARSAIGTKWYVDDVATSSFFVLFYDHLRRGEGKAEALQATQKAFANGDVRVEGNKVVGPANMTLLTDLPESYQHRYAKGFQHPYYWAGIQLVGSPW